jgi:hypothetical protein
MEHKNEHTNKMICYIIYLENIQVTWNGQPKD